MNSPCVRIEIEYTDGSKNIAKGREAQAIVDHLTSCQALAMAQQQWAQLLLRYPPQFEFIPPPVVFGLEGPPDSETEVRGGQESGL